MQCPSSNEKRLLRTAWNSSSYMGRWHGTRLINLSPFSVLPHFRLAFLSTLHLLVLNILTVTLSSFPSVESTSVCMSRFFMLHVLSWCMCYCHSLLFHFILSISASSFYNSCSIQLAFPGQPFFETLLFIYVLNNFEFWKSCATFHILSWHQRFFNLSLSACKEHNSYCFINTQIIYLNSSNGT